MPPSHATAPIAFLVAQHPAINHALLLREIRELRDLGLPIRTASIRSADRPSDQLTRDEQEEQEQTFYVIEQGWTGALAAHLPFFFGHPVRYLKGLLYALSLGRADLPKTVSLLIYFAEAVILGRWMERNQLRHIHVQYSSTVGLLLARMFPIELSISFHGPDEFLDPEGFWLRQKIDASAFLRAISFYSQSQIMKSCEVSQWDKIDVAYMGVDPEAFPPRPFRATPDPLELLCVGRLAPVKAQHILIQAVERLTAQGHRVRLHLAGGGPDRDSLEEAVRQRNLSSSVIVHGWVSQDQLDELYRQTDVFVLASFAEGLPGVLMEAMAMEIPCLSTWITGTPELIRDGIDGLLVPPSDPEAVAQAVARLIEDEDLRRTLGEAGRRRILERFHLRKNAMALYDIFTRRLAIERHASPTASSTPL